MNNTLSQQTPDGMKVVLDGVNSHRTTRLPGSRLRGSVGPRSARITRHSETARLPHAGPGGRHLESLNPPAFHRRITLLKPRHFAPPSQALTPSPRKPYPGAPQTCSTPDSHCPNIQNLRALFHLEGELFHSWLDDIRHHEVSMLPLVGIFLAYRSDVEARLVEIPSILR